MHALGRFLTRELEARGWSNAEFARRAGLSRQNVYQLTADNREHLGRLLEERTAHKIAAALEVPVETVWLKCLESLGVPAGNLQVSAAPSAEAAQNAPPWAEVLSNDVLLEQVRLRLGAVDRGDAAELARLRMMRDRLHALVDSLPTDAQTVSTSQVREVLTGDKK